MNPSPHRVKKKKIPLSQQGVRPPKTANHSLTLLILFFLQLVSDLAVQFYGTNLATLGHSHTKGFAFLSFLSPLLIVVAPIRTRILHLRAPAIALFSGLALCSFRAAAPFLNKESGRFLFDVLGIFSFWIYLPCRMAASTLPWSNFKTKRPRLCCSRALSIALAIIITFRTIGRTLDSSITPHSAYRSSLERILAALLAGAGVILLFVDYLFGDRTQKTKQGKLGTASRALEEFSNDNQQQSSNSTQILSPSSPQHPLEVANVSGASSEQVRGQEEEQQPSLGTSKVSEEPQVRRKWKIKRTLHRWVLCSWYATAISCSFLFGFQVFDSPATLARFLDVHSDLRFFALLTCMMFIMFSIFAISSYLFRISFVVKHPRVFFSGCFMFAVLFILSWFFVLFPSLSYDAENAVQREWNSTQIFFAVFMLVLTPVFFANISLAEYLLYYLQPSIRSLALGFSIANLIVLAFLAHSAVFIVPSLTPEKYSLLKYCIVLLSLALTPILVRSIQCLFYPKWICSRLRTLRYEPKELLLTSVLLFVLLILNVVFLIRMGSNAMHKADETISLEANGLNPPLRVMTYNIQMGFDRRGEMNWEELVDIIKAEDPDILGLQESATYELRKGNADIVGWLASRTNFPYYYAGAKGVFSSVIGLALLSKYPLVGLQTNFLEGNGPWDVFIQGEILLLNGKSVKLYVIHPCCTQEEITHQLEQISNQLGEKPTTQQLRFIMGDFNMVSNNTGLDSLRRIGFRDSFLDVFDASALSTFATNLEMDKRIDMVWLDSTLRAQSAKIVGLSDCSICSDKACQGTKFRQPCVDCIKCSASDHLPVVVELH